MNGGRGSGPEDKISDDGGDDPFGGQDVALFIQDTFM